MNTTRKIKVLLDAAMTLALLFLMGYPFWGNTAHEWVGIGIFALMIAHHLLNLGWCRAIFKGRYTPARSFQLVLNLLTLCAMLVLLYSSLVISRHVFGFLQLGGMALARRLHLLSSYWSMVLMSLHLGLHWQILLSAAEKRWAGRPRSRPRAALFFVLGLAIAAYGVYAFFARDYPTYLFAQSEFVFFDYEESPVLFYLDTISMMGAFIFLSHFLSRGLKRLRAKEHPSS